MERCLALASLVKCISDKSTRHGLVFESLRYLIIHVFIKALRYTVQGRIQPTNLTVSPEVGPHPNTNTNTNRQKSDRVPSNSGHPLDPPLH